ncbi:MAG TPA: hypothetical protein PKM25_14440, partial [Candidatus Ozemobacteraceae bacterium]|nr:hypothetical protein [Candidatus Ozemobacteraceae bacterium]
IDFTGAADVAFGLDEFTGLALDQKNPGLFWVSFKTATGGGWALYQHPVWRVIPHDQPVLGIVISDPFGFILTPDGVSRIML